MQWLQDLLVNEQRIAAWQEKCRVAPLIAVLRGGRDELKPLAETALAAIGPSAIPALLEASRKHGYGVLVEAGAAMGKMGTCALPQLIQAMEKETDRWVVKAIAIAMGEIGDPAAVPSLIAASRRVEEVDAIPEALGKIRDWHAADSLIEAYVTTRSDSYRDYVKRALKKIAKAVPPDRHALKERIEGLFTVSSSGGTKRGSKPSRGYAPDGWETAADRFVAESGSVSAPDFRVLQRELSGFSPQRQHDGWAKVASTFRQKDLEKLALQCAIQSLVSNPDPESDSWTKVRLSPLLAGNAGFMERLADLPRLRGSGSEPDLPQLARDLQIRFGFPGG